MYVYKHKCLQVTIKSNTNRYILQNSVHTSHVKYVLILPHDSKY